MKLKNIVSVGFGLCLALGVFQGKAFAESSEKYSAWYRFENSKEPGRSSGITPLPATIWKSSIGKGRFGQGLQLSGESRNGVYLQNPAAFFGKKAVQGTISLWIKPDAIDKKTQVIADFMKQCPRVSHVGGQRIIIYIRDDKLFATGFGPLMKIGNPLSPDKWTNLILTWNADKGMALYVNGKKAAESKGKFKPVELDSYWPGRIGCMVIRGGYPFSGSIDELRIMNYYIDDKQAAALAKVNPETLDLRIVPGKNGMFTVTNNGAKSVTVSSDFWAPAKYLQFPFYGFIPAGFNTIGWSAGPCKIIPSDRRILLAPGKSAKMNLSQDFAPLTRLRGRIMAGDGFAEREVSLPSSHESAIERKGLVFEIPSSKPVIFYANEHFTIPCDIFNDTGKDFSGYFIAELAGKDGKAVTKKRIALRVPQGKTVSFKVQFDKKFPPCGTDLKLYAEAANGKPVRIDGRRIYFTSKTNLKNINEVAVRMTDILDLRKHITQKNYASDAAYKVLTKHLLKDKVGVVIHNGNAMKDGTSFRCDLKNWLENGMKIWRGPVVSFKHNNIVCADPEKFKKLAAHLSELGEAMRNNPAVLAMVMAGEATNYPPCYCKHCTRSFREWLKKRYGTLEKLNKAWNSKYRNWNEINQLGSIKDIDKEQEDLQIRRVNLKIKKNYRKHWAKLFEQDRPRGMDWREWHDAVLIEWYKKFAAAFRKANGGATPIGEQPCWPVYGSQNAFALSKIADFGGLDSYLPADMVTTLGNCSGAMLNFDFNLSVYHAQNKPVMVNELYTLDNLPKGHCETMGWWLLGRGYRLPTFFTYREYREGVRQKVRVVFGIFDKNWKPYPSYESFHRYIRDMKKFNRTYDYNSTRRDKPQVAMLMGDDMARIGYLSTGGAVWNSQACRGNWGAYWLTQRNGYKMDFINEDGLSLLAGKRALVVPWSPVIRPEALRNILKFARNGGTVILDGPVGIYNNVYQPYNPMPGGKAFSKAAGMTFKGYENSPNRIVINPDSGPVKKSLRLDFESDKSVADDGKATVKLDSAKIVSGGKAGKGLKLPGVAKQGALLPDPEAFFGKTAERGTICLWVRPDFDPVKDKNKRVILDFMARRRKNRIGGREMAIYTTAGKLAASPSLSRVRRMQVPTPLKQGKWTHIALSWDCDIGANLYVDGKRVCHFPRAFPAVPLQKRWPGRIGYNATIEGGYPFAGTVDDLLMFNYSLSEQQINSIFRGDNSIVTENGKEQHVGSFANSFGIPVGVKIHGGKVLLRDMYGNPALVEARVGKGKIYSFLSSLGVMNFWNRAPEKELLNAWGNLFKDSGVIPRLNFTSVPEVPAERVRGTDVAGNKLKDTRPLFDASMRTKGDSEAFIFLTSYYAPSKGILKINLPKGNYTASDALTGKPVKLKRQSDRIWRYHVNLPQSGIQVLYVKSTDGKPFAGKNKPVK